MMQDRFDLLEGLSRAPGILSEFVKSIPEERLDLRRGKDFWTIAEHVSHLAEVQPMLLDRFERFINEEHPEFVPYIPGDAEDEPDTPARLTIADALDQFALYRDKQLTVLKSADDRIWQRNATHPEFNQYSFTILARHLLMHDYWHMYRMEELWLTKDNYLTALE